MTKGKKIKSFDFIRAVCTIGIVLFHYSYNYIEYGIGGNHIFFAKYGNGDWGGLFVAMFFMLSGALLYYNYGEKISVGRFYLKRWLSIFPMFYLAWFFGYLAKVRELGSWLWAGPRRVFIYTILGIDGYLLNPGVNINYYTLGEWFLGAILMLYLIFPILRIIFLRHERIGCVPRYVFTVVLFVLYSANLYFDWFAISDGKNMLTCIMDFWIGMLLMEYGRERFADFRVTAAAALLALVLMFAPFGMKEVMVSTLVGACLMTVFMNLGELAMNNRIAARIAGCISRWSFGIFLVHHVILYAYMKQFSGTEVGLIKSIGIFIFILLVIIAVGGILSKWGEIVSRFVLKVISGMKIGG